MMSSDNFWIVDKEHRVWMGDASGWFFDSDKAQTAAWRKYVAKVMRRSKPQFEGKTADEAIIWASREYSEYGIWGEQDENGDWII